MTVRILAAGDHFILSRHLADALRAECGPGPDITELTLPWPVEPARAVAEVREASGTESQLVTALRGVRICVTQTAPLTEKVFAASPDLRLVCVGRDVPVNVNVDAAARHGVTVTGTPEPGAAAVAEHTLGLILAAIRRIPETHLDLTAGRWRGDYHALDRTGPAIAGSVAGVIGHGAAAREVARVLRACGATVLVHDPDGGTQHGGTRHGDDTQHGGTRHGAAQHGGAWDDGVRHVSLDELLRRCGIVTLHTRARPGAAPLIGADRIAAMPRGSVLVNCADGALVDYDAVCDALDCGHLFAAAFDVFPEEPVAPGSRLLFTPHLVMTPRLARAGRRTAEEITRALAADVGRYLRGELPDQPAAGRPRAVGRPVGAG